MLSWLGPHKTRAFYMLSPSKPGLLMVSNFLSGSLTTRGVCEDLAERLAQAGWKVVTTSAKVNRIARLCDMLRTASKYRQAYSVAQVDVFSGAAFFWAEMVCYRLRRWGKPYVLTLHGGNLPLFGQRWPGRTARLLQSAAVVTTPSRFLLERMKPYRVDLKLLPNPLDISRYAFRPRTSARPKLVWLRAFHSIYNPALAPQVVARLAADFADVQLSMVGPDKQDGSLEQTRQMAETLGVTERISFTGPVPKLEVPKAIAAGDIFLNTTNVDNTPVSVLEAMACGLCVVTTNVGGLPYLVEDGQDALLVPPADASSMAAAVGKVLRHKDLSAGLSVKGRKKAEQFDWSVVLPQWEAILQQTPPARELSPLARAA
jgi:glycosyltransferase involved in cell wall biosynthesis